MNLSPAMNNAAVKYLESHQTGGKNWPLDAEYAVKYNMSTWPLGWQKEANVEFFPTLEALEAWKAVKHDWALCEDNYVAYTVYEWDLSPNVRADLSHDQGNVGLTYKERQRSIFG
jgi:hypothetical protein